MKRVLITGKNSYIGRNFKSYIESKDNGWAVDKLDVRGDEWWAFDFSVYDAVLHVAGIAHVDTRGASEDTKRFYYVVNTELAVEVATIAKQKGIK